MDRKYRSFTLPQEFYQRIRNVGKPRDPSQIPVRGVRVVRFDSNPYRAIGERLLSYVRKREDMVCRLQCFL